MPRVSASAAYDSAVMSPADRRPPRDAELRELASFAAVRVIDTSSPFMRNLFLSSSRWISETGGARSQGNVDRLTGSVIASPGAGRNGDLCMGFGVIAGAPLRRVRRLREYPPDVLKTECAARNGRIADIATRMLTPSRCRVGGSC